jgi:hypothetical protein
MMLFRRSSVGVAALAALLAACSAAPLPEAVSSPDPANPAAPVSATPYRPVLAGTAAHVPVGLKPWRELNEEVAPGGGRSP